MTPGVVRALVSRHWLIDAVRVAELHGGMNSETWEITGPASRWVLKIVAPHHPPGFTAGLVAATVLEGAGLRAGAPVPTHDGRIAIETTAGTAALLTWVEGEALVASPDTVGHLGRTLARAHSILRHAAIPDAPPFDWIDCAAPHLAVEAWVRPAVTEAVHEWEAARDAVPTWGFLHGDPAPEVFRHDVGTDSYAMIDWASGVHGPLLYDLASATMYVGEDLTPALVEAYAGLGAVSWPEIDRGLPTLQRYRYAVQADYFARRVHDHDLTGIAEASENLEGLADARLMLGA